MSEQKESATRQGGATTSETNKLNSKNGSHPITTRKSPERVLSTSEMVRKARAGAARQEADLEEIAREKVNALLDNFGLLFEERMPLLVPCVRGAKNKPLLKWGELTQEKLDDNAEYFSKLTQAVIAGGNIAIKLGIDSHHLAAIDFDSDDWVAPFVELNPALGESLCTRGSRGCQLWFFAKGYYPREVQHFEINGSREGTGEFRGGKCLSTIWGVHPTGVEYQRINDVRPIDFAFSDIKWPAGWKLAETKNPSEIKIDYQRYFDMVKDADGGVVEALVELYFEGAVEREGKWRCADVTGRKPKTVDGGSFEITKTGLCREWDGGYPIENTDIVKVICSAERAQLADDERITEEEVFNAIKETCEEDFFIRHERELSFDRFNVWYDKVKAKFHWKAPDGTWSLLPEKLLSTQLRVVHKLSANFPKDEKGNATDNKSEIDCVVSDAIQNRRVDFSLRGLAGHKEGIERFSDGTTYLIERSGNWVIPVKGDWRPIEKFLKGLFREQYDYIIGNLCYWARDYHSHNYAPRPAIVLAGPRKCGKNLFQDSIVTKLFGGTSADPTQYLTKGTAFNSELFPVPHLMIADSLHSSDPKARAALESAIKETTASRSQRAHGKGKDALNQLRPFWRLTVSLNDDGPGLSLLPRPDGSMSDKMLLFQVTRPDDMPTTDEEVKGNYIPALENAIPAFLYYLLHDHTIPDALRTDRAGIIPYQNPDLVAELVGESREALITDKLYQFYFMGRNKEQKEKKITEQSSAIFAALETRDAFRRSFERLNLDEQNFGKLLTAIAERPIEGAYVEVKKRKTRGKFVYDITWKSDPPEPEKETAVDPEMVRLLAQKAQI